MEDWTVQSVIILIGGVIFTVGLWALFLWTTARDDIKRK